MAENGARVSLVDGGVLKFVSVQPEDRCTEGQRCHQPPAAGLVARYRSQGATSCALSPAPVPVRGVTGCASVCFHWARAARDTPAAHPARRRRYRAPGPPPLPRTAADESSASRCQSAGPPPAPKAAGRWLWPSCDVYAGWCETGASPPMRSVIGQARFRRVRASLARLLRRAGYSPPLGLASQGAT